MLRGSKTSPSAPPDAAAEAWNRADSRAELGAAGRSGTSVAASGSVLRGSCAGISSIRSSTFTAVTVAGSMHSVPYTLIAPSDQLTSGGVSIRASSTVEAPGTASTEVRAARVRAT